MDFDGVRKKRGKYIQHDISRIDEVKRLLKKEEKTKKISEETGLNRTNIYHYRRFWRYLHIKAKKTPADPEATVFNLLSLNVAAHRLLIETQLDVMYTYNSLIDFLGKDSQDSLKIGVNIFQPIEPTLASIADEFFKDALNKAIPGNLGKTDVNVYAMIFYEPKYRMIHLDDSETIRPEISKTIVRLISPEDPKGHYLITKAGLNARKIYRIIQALQSAICSENLRIAILNDWIEAFEPLRKQYPGITIELPCVQPDKLENWLNADHNRTKRRYVRSTKHLR